MAKLANVNRSSGWTEELYQHKDRLWSLVWLTGIILLLVWDSLYLNRPALVKVLSGALNTFLISLSVVILALALAWLAVNIRFYIMSQQWRLMQALFNFFLDLLRAVPQVVGILLGFVLIAGLLYRGMIGIPVSLILIAVVIALFVFLELVDLMQERVDYFKQLDFYQAMSVCGIKGRRILNYHILWKNSRRHIFNKLVSVFGIAIFLLCSVDFIISVGLSTDISSVDLPVTLGSLLAHIDSKQDILAIGHTLTHPAYIGNLFFKHLQGISTAFLIVFSLLCVYKISNGFAERHRL